MDYALVNLVVTILILVATFAFRKRILKALGRFLLNGAIEFARGTFLTQDVSEAEDGSKVARIGLSAQGKAIVGAAVPVLLAEVAKNVKLKLPAGGPGGLTLPEGADLLSLAPQFLGMLPKKYQGIAGLALPFLQGFLGKGGTSGGPMGSSPSGTMSEITKKLIP